MAGEVKKELGGTWVLEKSENVDKYLKELGLGYCERKCMVNTGRHTITVNDDVITIEMDYGKRNVKFSFKLDEEFELNFGKASKAIVTWKDGTLIQHCRRVETGRLQVVERKRCGDKLIQTMTSNGVTCKRIMIRLAGASV